MPEKYGEWISRRQAIHELQMTEPTEQQVEAGAEALWNVDQTAEVFKYGDHYVVRRWLDAHPSDQAEMRLKALAVLVAALGATQGIRVIDFEAESAKTHEALRQRVVEQQHTYPHDHEAVTTACPFGCPDAPEQHKFACPYGECDRADQEDTRCLSSGQPRF